MISGRIPVIGGTGALGFGLAVRWALAGARVTLGSRSMERARRACERILTLVPGADVEGLENTSAATRGDIVFLTVPFSAQLSTLSTIADVLPSRAILVDCTVPLATAIGGRPTSVLGVWEGSAAEQAQAAVRQRATVVSGLHSLSAASLTDLEQPLDEDVLLCGTRKADKARVAELVQLIPGLRAVNAGALANARIAEQLTALLITINGRYKTHTGLRIVRLPASDHWSDRQRSSRHT